jgi:outer membrane protein
MMNIGESRQAFAFRFRGLSFRQFRARILSARSGVLLAAGGALLMSSCLLTSCTTLKARPELRPQVWAPPSATREWVQSRMTARQYELESIPAVSIATPRGPKSYDLPDLIDLALRKNPGTRRQWQVARSAAAQFGAAQSPYYPQVVVEAANGYQRTIIELPAMAGRLEQWQSQPLVQATYVLLDFGRRRSAAEAARNYLIASDFAFNRAIQQVVFSTQSAYYSLDSAQSGVIAAQQNLELAVTDFDAVKQRVELGLATQPELLLAKERLAQSRFDLANARLQVHDAEAQLAVALGIPANQLPDVQSLQNQPVPRSLQTSVDELIASADRLRPDLAARVANLRASEANLNQARAQFWPVVGLSADYGENVWNFTFASPRTVQTSQPQYAAMVTLKWDVFTGFRRVNDVRRAEADRQAATADLQSLEVDTAAQVWRTYYEFESSLSKYEYAQSLLAAAQEAYDANLETYRQGLSTIVELLTAQRDLANARYTLIQSKAELLTADAAVAFAAGTTINAVK